MAFPHAPAGRMGGRLMAPKPSDIDLDRVEALRRAGLTWAVIAARMGTTAAHIHRLRVKARQRAADAPQQPAAD